jgi:hypothetical protein
MKVTLRLVPALIILAVACEVQKATAPNPAIVLSKQGPERGPKDNCAPSTGNRNAPDSILCAIEIPGNPILSGTKSWIAGERYYLTDVSNAGVDVVDGEKHAVVGRIGGFVGATGVAATSGPNSIVFTDPDRAWVSDGHSDVHVVDVRRMTLLADLSTAIPACDGGTATTHFCQRTNEITYDPEDRVILIGNPSPLSVSGTHPAIDTYATFISAVPPYHVLGTISFPNSRGHEAPLWDQGLHRFLMAVSGRLAGTTVIPQYVAVINPKTMLMEKQYVIDCAALVGTAPGALFGINDPALGPHQRFVIPGCGHAIVMDARTGAVIKVFREIGGGNETWYNSGDNRYYVTGVDSTQTPPVNSLGVIDARTNTFLQGVPDIGGTNPASFSETNETFTVVQVTAAQVATPATDNTACTRFGIVGKGCVTVFGHVGKSGPDHDHDRDE